MSGHSSSSGDVSDVSLDALADVFFGGVTEFEPTVNSDSKKIHFDTGSQFWDRYFEAYYEVKKIIEVDFYEKYGNDRSNYFYGNLLPNAKNNIEIKKSITVDAAGRPQDPDDYYLRIFNSEWDNPWAFSAVSEKTVDEIFNKKGISKRVSPCDFYGDELREGGDSICTNSAGAYDFSEDFVNADSNTKKYFDPITYPSKFKKKSANKITDFNPSTDTLEIDTDSFGIDSSATFASGKNKKKVKKKLAKQDFDFLYDEKKGGLYFNENGSNKGFGEGGIIAILKGAPDLSLGNLEFI